ncbi:efflux RND transporter periplasmic adaptor subunit [Paenibacillus rigui]|uniref:Uncharacterized protein n=1 Tax=Paenibacillus rigui TaxID=554312 RepID=A0A229UGS5_9BACL|nr:efflux RND transporter periplasmic adaptor subunit [Paenibacillus rigui]OXM82561.1 hypothetical protein CF651_30215 [Paenibacillus rigui]
MQKRWWLLILAFIALGASSFVYFQDQQVLKVNAVRTLEGELVNYIQTTGKVRVQQEHKVFAHTEGKIQQLSLKLGDRVNEGQVLARVDNSDFSYKIRQLEAQMEQSQASLAKLQEGVKTEMIRQLEEAARRESIQYEAAKRAWIKTQNLYDEGQASKDDLYRTKDEFQLAESRLQEAQSNLQLKQKGPDQPDLDAVFAKLKELQLQKEEMEAEMQKDLIISPVNGTVIGLGLQAGQYVQKGAELLTIADLSQVEIISNVKESLVGDVYVGQAALIQGGILGKAQLEAHVVRMDPVAQNAKDAPDKAATVAVALQLNQPSDKLVPGYNLDINFVHQRVSSVIQVPYDAIKRNQDGSSLVWTVIEGKAVLTKVDVGIKNERFVEIKNGLKKDDWVILNPSDAMREGQKVSIR